VSHLSPFATDAGARCDMVSLEILREEILCLTE